MDYVHFDREAVAAAIRKSGEESLALALSAAPDEISRNYVRMQHRFTDAVAEFSAICIDLRNERAPEDMVAAAVGANLGAIAAMIFCNAADRPSCINQFQRTFQGAIEAIIIGGRSAFSSAGPVFVDGERGGRA